jgi:hypothetical protein
MANGDGKWSCCAAEETSKIRARFHSFSLSAVLEITRGYILLTFGSLVTRFEPIKFKDVVQICFGSAWRSTVWWL